MGELISFAVDHHETVFKYIGMGAAGLGITLPFMPSGLTVQVGTVLGMLAKYMLRQKPEGHGKAKTLGKTASDLVKGFNKGLE